MWAYESSGSEAIGKGCARTARSPADHASTPPRAGRRGRLGTLATMFASALTEHIVTVSLTWGALNEWPRRRRTYGSQRTGHPTLAELVRRIAKQEGRHIDFYASEATRVSTTRVRNASPLGALPRWTPVGSGVMPPGDRTSHHLPVRRRRRRRDGKPDRPSHRPPPRALRARADRWRSPRVRHDRIRQGRSPRRHDRINRGPTVGGVIGP